MWPAMNDPGIPALQADALFAPALQRSDEPSAGQIRQAVVAAIRAFGWPGCARYSASSASAHASNSP